MTARGVEDVRKPAGGITDGAREVDPESPVY
jgi:hypothetical protein